MVRRVGSIPTWGTVTPTQVIDAVRCSGSKVSVVDDQMVLDPPPTGELARVLEENQGALRAIRAQEYRSDERCRVCAYRGPGGYVVTENRRWCRKCWEKLSSE